MGWLAATAQVMRDALGMPRLIDLELTPEHTFDTAPRPVDRVISAMKNGTGSVTRDRALQVAAVQRGRNELCSISTLPLKLYLGLNVVDSPLFRQYDPDVPNVVHMARTIEDLVFDGVAWWQVTGQDFEGYPVSVRRVDPDRVTLKPPRGKTDPDPARPNRYVWVDSDDGRGPQPVPAELMKRFDSPNPAVLKANAAAIRIAGRLDALTEMYADNPALREYFTDADDLDVDGLTDDEVDEFLAEYGAMRQSRPFGWIPATVKRADVTSPSPRDLTLVELRQQAHLAIANGMGVDPEDLGVSTTSRTYFNSVDKKQDKINRTYAPYMRAITDRLSMGDVTRRGYAAQFDLTDYLKSSPAEQAAYWAALKGMGVTDADEIRGWAGLSGPAPKAVAAAPAPLAVAAAYRPPLQLGDITPARVQLDAGGPAFTFHATEFAAAVPAAPAVDETARTITGLALPYNAVAVKYGLKLRFRPGSLEHSEPGRMAALMDHQTPVGFHRTVEDSAAGPVVALAVLDGPEGSAAKSLRDQLLYDAAHGLYSGLSVGVDFSMDPEMGDVEYNAEDDVYDVVRATWRETSITYLPAFDDARVTQVAASANGGSMPECIHCHQRHAANIACATFAAQLRTAPVPTPPAEPGTGTPPGTPPPPNFDPAAMAAFAAWHQQQNTPVGIALGAGPTVVSPHHGPAQVTEPDPYTFDRQGNLRAGSHDFSSDLVSGWRDGDASARDRAEGFLRRQFAVTPANVATLNPNRNRPDLYVDQMEYEYPILDAVNKGTLTDMTPFVIPKFNTATGLVADHVTGTEPTAGAFTATSQTITPSAISGKVEITREAFDQGGNPQMSGLIWRQMTRGYYEAAEAYAVAQLAAVAASIPDITFTALAVDAALDQSITDGLVPLQYIRGGNRFRTVFTQIDLYKAMVKAKDTAGRRLYPQIGPQNAVGTVESGYTAIDAHGMRWLPAWALAATGTVEASSYAFDPEKVCMWLSAPQRIDLQWRVAWVDLGIWGYKAFGVTDFAGTRELKYDPI